MYVERRTGTRTKSKDRFDERRERGENKKNLVEEIEKVGK